MYTTPIALSLVLASAPFAADALTSDQCGSQCGSKAKATLAANEVGKDIVETAVAAGEFNTLARLLTKAELVEALQGEGPFTVFAPKDSAFAKLAKENEGILETLLKEENAGMLTNILTYHVVPGKVMAKDVVELTTATSLLGQRLDVTVTEGTVMIDGAKVIATDIECSNGVIHVVDSVLLPESKNLV
ncbi:MAG: fasciclin domain-containing protein, partial [Planctomycetota bacterium]